MQEHLRNGVNVHAKDAVCESACLCAHVRARLCARVRARVCLCVSVCMCACVRVCLVCLYLSLALSPSQNVYAGLRQLAGTPHARKNTLDASRIKCLLGPPAVSWHGSRTVRTTNTSVSVQRRMSSRTLTTARIGMCTRTPATTWHDSHVSKSDCRLEPSTTDDARSIRNLV